MTSAGNGQKQTSFLEFYDQVLSQRKENLTKCSHKTEEEFQIIWPQAKKKKVEGAGARSSLCDL